MLTMKAGTMCIEACHGELQSIGSMNILYKRTGLRALSFMSSGSSAFWRHTESAVGVGS
jgi:hypothetical protein